MKNHFLVVVTEENPAPILHVEATLPADTETFSEIETDVPLTADIPVIDIPVRDVLLSNLEAHDGESSVIVEEECSDSDAETPEEVLKIVPTQPESVITITTEVSEPIEGLLVDAISTSAVGISDENWEPKVKPSPTEMEGLIETNGETNITVKLDASATDVPSSEDCTDIEVSPPILTEEESQANLHVKIDDITEIDEIVLQTDDHKVETVTPCLADTDAYVQDVHILEVPTEASHSIDIDETKSETTSESSTQITVVCEEIIDSTIEMAVESEPTVSEADFSTDFSVQTKTLPEAYEIMTEPSAVTTDESYELATELIDEIKQNVFDSEPFHSEEVGTVPDISHTEINTIAPVTPEVSETIKLAETMLVETETNLEEDAVAKVNMDPKPFKIEMWASLISPEGSTSDANISSEPATGKTSSLNIVPDMEIYMDAIETDTMEEIPTVCECISFYESKSMENLDQLEDSENFKYVLEITSEDETISCSESRVETNDNLLEEVEQINEDEVNITEVATGENTVLISNKDDLPKESRVEDTSLILVPELTNTRLEELTDVSNGNETVDNIANIKENKPLEFGINIDISLKNETTIHADNFDDSCELENSTSEIPDDVMGTTVAEENEVSNNGKFAEQNI